MNKFPLVPVAVGAAALGALYFLTRSSVPSEAQQRANLLDRNAQARTSTSGRLSSFAPLASSGSAFSRVGMAMPSWGSPYAVQHCSDAPSPAAPLPAVASTSFTTMAPVSQLQEGTQFAATGNDGQETLFRANAWPDVQNPKGPIIDATNLSTGVAYSVALGNLS